MINIQEPQETFEDMESWWTQVVGPVPDRTWLPEGKGSDWMALLERFRGILEDERQKARENQDFVSHNLDEMRRTVEMIAGLSEPDDSDSGIGAEEVLGEIHRIARAALGREKFSSEGVR